MTTIKIRGKEVEIRPSSRPLAEIRKEVKADGFYREIALLGKTLEEMEALVKLNETDPNYNKKLLADERQYLKELKITQNRKQIRTRLCNFSDTDTDAQADSSKSYNNDSRKMNKNLQVPFIYSDDFSLITFPKRKPFKLTYRQSKIIEHLHRLSQTNHQFVLKKNILEAIDGHTNSRWADAFRSHKAKTAYNLLIEDSADKKSARLRLTRSN